MTAMLALREKEALDACERKIERGLATFVEVGRALAEIRDRRYYRETHDTFEAYCRDRWGLRRDRAYQLMEAAGVVENFRHDDRPEIESHARELAPVPEAERADVWREANERTDGKPTAAAIRDVRNERYPQTPRAQDELPDEARPVAQPVEDLGAPAPSVTPTPEAIERHEHERAARVSREVASANLAKSIWLLSGQAGMDHRVDQILANWEPSQDIYPQPTTAERIKTVADYLFELSERWPQ